MFSWAGVSAARPVPPSIVAGATFSWRLLNELSTSRRWPLLLTTTVEVSYHLFLSFDNFLTPFISELFLSLLRYHRAYEDYLTQSLLATRSRQVLQSEGQYIAALLEEVFDLNEQQFPRHTDRNLLQRSPNRRCCEFSDFSGELAFPGRIYRDEPFLALGDSPGLYTSRDSFPKSSISHGHSRFWGRRSW